MLSAAYRVRLATEWAGGDDDVLIALHARRSAAAVAAWRRDRPGAPVVVVLTGTDLYRDIATDPTAQATLHSAHRLVVLNGLGAQALPAALRAKAHVVLQSCGARRAMVKTTRHLRAIAVGHLREEKSPQTFFTAARLLAQRSDIRLDHVGAALDPALGAQATALAAEHPHYRWLGALPHGQARRRIQAAHVLVHPSRMEGGAHVVTEALRSGTPVLASDIPGNVGLLGADYGGYFPVGDAAALAHRMQQFRDQPAMLQALAQQCNARAALFDPAREAATLHAILSEVTADLLQPTHPNS